MNDSGPQTQNKALRFVNTQGGPPSKRPRIEAACRTCRRRKTKCSGERPVCVTCTKNGHVCVGYDDLLDKKDKKKRVELLSPHSSIPNPVAANKAEAKPPSSTDGAAAADVLPLKYKDEWNSARRPPGAYHGIKRKVPYFRYFGPTAIVPGYKQTTVSVRDRRRSRGDDSLHSLAAPDWTWLQALGTPSSGPSHAAFSWNDPPVYDYDGGCKDPVDSRIITLVETFFFQLGPNYPFLRMRRILHAIKQKTLEPILVNSMCALAARFSDLTGPENKFEDLERSEFGHVYAARAHKDTVGTFACPSVAAVQACLLMAYEGFGSNQDSALWMYLGLAIRMAVDLGLGKHVGVIYPGGSDPWYIRGWKRPPTVNQQKEDTDDADDAEDEEALEKERTDTFWAIFILDRVISSGTGRPVTFREDDYELDLPETTAEVVPNLPHPFSCLVRMIYLYGLVSDIFNNVKNTEDLTAEKLSQLGTIENTLISQYLTLDSRLGIDIENFRNYVRAGHGTSYILLHIWFHALVIVLNQPTLLPFGNMSHMAMKSEGKQLAMSSAKSIADILHMAEFVDPKSLWGNPFTSQPMYIAACSFLTEHSANTPIPPIPGTRDASPRHETSTPLRPGTSKTARQHAILADSTSANYTTCYKTLQQLRVYWAGVDYVLEALNQRAGGLCNESSFDHTNTDMPENLLPFGGNRIRSESLRRLPQLEARMDHAPSPAAPLVAFTIVGTTDSSKLELTCMYPGQSRDAASSKSTASAPTPQGNMVYDPIRHPHSPPPPRYPQAASPWEYDWSMPQNDQSGPPGQATPIYTSGSEQSPVNEPVHDACSPKSGDRQPTSSSDNHSYSLSSTGSAEADATRNGGGGPKNDYGVYSALPSAINNQDSQVMSAQFPMVPGRLPEMITTSTELPLDDLPLSEVQLMDIFLPAEELGLWPWQNDASQM